MIKILRIAIILIAITFLSLGAYFGYSKYQKLAEEARYKALAKEFNDTQWQKFMQAWEVTKLALKPLDACRNQLDAYKDKLLPQYKDYLSKQTRGENLTKDDRLLAYTYENTKDASSEIYSIIRDFVQLNPVYKSDYFIHDWAKALGNQTMTEVKFQQERNHSIEELNNTFDHYQKLKNSVVTFYCPKVDTITITYTERTALCKEFKKLEIVIRKPPQPENYELPEQYQLELKGFDEGLTQEINSCDNFIY